MRALHVVGAMNRGGVETWLLNVMRQVPRDDVAMDVMVHTDARAAYDDELEALGVVIHRNPHTGNPGRYVARLRRILGAHRYDVVHSHVHHFSGVVLAAARLSGVPVRIAHSHNDTRSIDSAASLARRAYLALMTRMLHGSATAGFACSDAAGAALFGETWHEDGRWRRLYCGIDSAPFGRTYDRERTRAELSVAVGAPLMIHVGRFEAQKNHLFLVDVLAAVRRLRPAVMLLLVGSGPLEREVTETASARGVSDAIRFCGSRSDVPRLLSAADVFVFPSLYEGLGLACLEAQAAGLPVVMAETIPREVVVHPAQVVIHALGEPEVWAASVSRAFDIPVAERTKAVLEHGAFDIRTSANALVASYRTALGPEHASAAASASIADVPIPERRVSL